MKKTATMNPQQHVGTNSYPQQSIYNPAVPFSHNIGGLYPGKMIFISGIPHPNSKRFTLNFECGPSTKEIAFHFDVRVDYGNDKNTIVRNTHTKGSGYGPEERTAPCFPFSPDKFFDMTILVEEHVFKVAVNNQHLLEFANRGHKLNSVDTLRITGDLKLTQVRFQ